MTDRLIISSKAALVPRFALAASGCVLFIVAKSMATGGQANVGQPVYWLIGLLPFAVWGLPVAINWLEKWRSSNHRKLLPSNLQRLVSEIAFRHLVVWVCTLGVFVASHELQLANSIQSPVYEAMGYRNFTATNFILSLMYVGAGYLIWAIFFSLRDVSVMGSRARLVDLLALFVINAGVFFALVYLIPAV
jgi:hypothetical protein